MDRFDAPQAHQATRIDDIHGRYDPWLIGAALALVALGVVMVGSSSIAIGEDHGVGAFHFLTRHLMFLAVGVVLCVLMARTELKSIEEYNQLLLLGCFVLLLVVFIPGLGHTVNGARRWINLGVSNFQTVEAVKLMYIVWLASYLVRFRDEVNATWGAMIKPLVVAGALMGLLLLQPDFGSTALILGVDKERAARFSFLMVLIPILGGSFLQVLDYIENPAIAGGISGSSLVAGFISAFVAGLIACIWMINIVKKGKLIYFAIYCAVVGIVAIIFGI